MYRDLHGEAIHEGDFVTWAGGAGFVERVNLKGVLVQRGGKLVTFGVPGSPTILLTADSRELE